MKGWIISCFLLLFSCLSTVSAQKVGIVLSGGGAKGVAHVGVIKALEEHNIPIDYIAGTSMGAIVGSMYAMGYTPEEMLALLLSDDFQYWQTGEVEESYVYFFKKPDDAPDFMHFPIEMTDSLQVKTNLLPGSLVNPIQMNQAFMGLFAQATAKSSWNFNNLFVPFRCVSSDVYNKKAVVWRNGDLGEAVRSSMTFPFFFRPIWKDGVPLFDGGIYNNFPVDVMKEDFHPDFILGSAVAGGDNKPSDNPMSQIERMVMQHTDYNVEEEDGMIIRFRMPDVSLLDFQRAGELMELGYQRTLHMIDSIKARVPREVPLSEINARRKAYKESLPPLMFKNIYITGSVTDAQREYISDQLHKDINNEFSMEDFKRAYFKMLTDDKIKEIIPQAIYNWKNNNFDLYLDVTVSEELKISIGGNISSHQANQLYLGLDYQGLGEVASGVSVNVQMGNSFSGAMLSGRIYLPTQIPSYLNLQMFYSNRNYVQDQSLFYEEVMPAFIKQTETFARLELGLPFMDHSKTEFGVAYGRLNDNYYQTNNVSFSDAKFDRSRYNFFNAFLQIERNSLNAKQYPISGRQQIVTANYITGGESYQPFVPQANNRNSHGSHNWLQVKGRWVNYTSFGEQFRLGVMGELVVSSKNLMSNYTASILQAPAFTPTPHSKVVFNEAFRANQYVAGGVIPIVPLSKIFHWRTELYGFMPVYPIKKEILGNAPYLDRPYYGELFQRFEYMGETALVLQLPFVSASLFVNGYSYPSKNFNIGVNIGFLIFNPGFLE